MRMWHFSKDLKEVRREAIWKVWEVHFRQREDHRKPPRQENAWEVCKKAGRPECPEQTELRD